MKKSLISLITFLLLGFLSALTVYAQAPNKFYYQAEARDIDGKLIKNATLQVKITILAGSRTGTTVWEGYHEVRTDRFGLFTLKIGKGTGGSFKFKNIDWANDRHYLNVQVNDINGNWVDMGTTRFLSVPYALHAKTAANVFSGSYDDLLDAPLDVTPGGNVGIGVPDPQEALDVLGNVHASEGFIVGSTTYYNDGSITLSDGTHLDINSGTLFIDNTNDRVGIGTTSPSVKLDVVGILKATEFVGDGSGLTGIISTEADPVFSNQFNITSPVENQLLKYNSGSSKWENVDASTSEGWSVSGNAGTDPAVNFLGTTDDNPLVFRVYYRERMRLNKNGNLAFSGTGRSVFIGEGAGENDDLSENRNVFIGFEAGNSNTSGFYNTAYGYRALYKNTSGSYNTANGFQALNSNEEGRYNTASGLSALYYNDGGNCNTATGSQALYLNTNGGNNTATGYQALYSNTQGIDNTATGYQALFSNTGGFENTVIGSQALFRNTIGEANTTIGYKAMMNNTEGHNNTAIGHVTLHSNIKGYHNTAYGSGALRFNTEGFYNTAIGSSVLNRNTSGFFNTAVGYGSGTTSGNLSNTGAFGYEATVTASNTFVFGNRNVVGWGFGVSPGSAAIRVGTSNSNGNGATLTLGGIWTDASDLSKKYDIEDINYGLTDVMKLRPVTYKLKGLNNQDIGFIAQEVREILPEIVYGEDGQMTMSYGQVTSVLVKAIQEQQQMIEELQQEIENLQNK